MASARPRPLPLLDFSWWARAIFRLSFSGLFMTTADFWRQVAAVDGRQLWTSRRRSFSPSERECYAGAVYENGVAARENAHSGENEAPCHRRSCNLPLLSPGCMWLTYPGDCGDRPS